MSAPFYDTGGGGGAGGGGEGGGGAGGGGGGFAIIDTNNPNALINLVSRPSTLDPWDKPARIAQLVGITVEQYRGADAAQRKAWRHQAKARFIQERETRQGDVKGLAKAAQRLGDALAVAQRSAEFWRLPARERNNRLRLLRKQAAPSPGGTGTTTPGTGGTTPSGSQRTPSQLQVDALEQLARIAAQLREWWYAREQQRIAEREARRLRRGGSMALGDIITGLGGALERTATAVSPIVQAIYQERMAREMSRAGATGASGVPVAFADPTSGLGDLLPQLGQGILNAIPNTPLLNLLPGGGGMAGDEVQLWARRSGDSRAYPQRTVFSFNPDTGAIGAWEYAGKPVLYSRDLAVCKRVNRITRRSAGRVGLRFRRRGRGR